MEKLFYFTIMLCLFLSCEKHENPIGPEHETVHDNQKFIGNWSGTRKITSQVSDEWNESTENVSVSILSGQSGNRVIVFTSPSCSGWHATVVNNIITLDKITYGDAGAKWGDGFLSVNKLNFSYYWWIASCSSANGKSEFWVEHVLTKDDN